MNGAGPPDRAQPLDLSTLQGRARAQTPCFLLTRRILKKDGRRAAPMVGDDQAGNSHR